jgi:hypothetical protein
MGIFTIALAAGTYGPLQTIDGFNITGDLSSTIA